MPPYELSYSFSSLILSYHQHLALLSSLFPSGYSTKYVNMDLYYFAYLLRPHKSHRTLLEDFNDIRATLRVV